MRIGPHEFGSNLFLSPLAGYTNLPFRLIVRELGGVGLCTTDLVNARSLLERHRQSLELISSPPADRPLAVQIYGAVAGEMRDAAQLLESLGVAVVDVNMGCPVRKVCRGGGGSALLSNPAQTVRLVEGMVQAVRIPVTCKMRLGWDDRNLTAPDLARALDDVGVAAITVHGRTRQQGFGGAVNLAGIRAVVSAVKRAVVVGNGDVTTPRAARQMFTETGCAAISIGRGAFYNPWIFQQTAQYLATGVEPPEPDIEERLRLMRCHLERMVEVFGEEHGCRKFRKAALLYSKRFGPAKEFDRHVSRLGSRAEFEQIVTAYRAWRGQFCDEHGRLLPRFAPRPVAVAGRTDGIVMPPGPNEWW